MTDFCYITTITSFSFLLNQRFPTKEINRLILPKKLDSSSSFDLSSVEMTEERKVTAMVALDHFLKCTFNPRFDHFCCPSRHFPKFRLFLTTETFVLCFALCVFKRIKQSFCCCAFHIIVTLPIIKEMERSVKD